MMLKSLGHGNQNRIFYYLLGVISIVSLFLMIASGSRIGLWNDELATIASLNAEDMAFSDWLLTLQGGSETGFSIWRIVTRIWYEIVPADDNWIALMSELYAAISVFVVGLTGKIIKNAACGLLAAALYGFSYQLFEIGHEFRFYAWLVMFTSLSFYFYCRLTVRKNCGIRDMVFFGLSVGLLCNGQILAAFFPIVLFFADLALIKKGKKHAKALISYVIALPLALLPALATITFLSGTYSQGEAYLVGIYDASFSGLLNLQNHLWLDEQAVFVVLPYIAFAFGLFSIARIAHARQTAAFENPRKQYLFSVSAIAPAVCILISFALSRVENIFSPRYFQYLYPLIFIAISFTGITSLERMFSGGRRRGQAIFISGLAVLLAVQAYNLSLANPMYDGIKKEANWVIDNAEIVGEEPLIVLHYHDHDDGARTNAIRRIYFEGKYPQGAVHPWPYSLMSRERVLPLGNPSVVVFSTAANTYKDILSENYTLDYRDDAAGVSIWKQKGDHGQNNVQ